MRLLVNCLEIDPELLHKYNNIIIQHLEKGITERVGNSTLDGIRSHYLSHHPVLTPSKATTNVHIIYDGSAKGQSCSNSLSLNECLFHGPIVLPNLSWNSHEITPDCCFSRRDFCKLGPKIANEMLPDSCG